MRNAWSQRFQPCSSTHLIALKSGAWWNTNASMPVAMGSGNILYLVHVLAHCYPMQKDYAIMRSRVCKYLSCGLSIVASMFIVWFMSFQSLCLSNCLATIMCWWLFVYWWTCTKSSFLTYSFVVLIFFNFCIQILVFHSCYIV